MGLKRCCEASNVKNYPSARASTKMQLKFHNTFRVLTKYGVQRFKEVLKEKQIRAAK